MSTTELPTTPDLSDLPKRQQLNAAVAITQGAHWSKDGELWLGQYLIAYTYVYGSERIHCTPLFPDYAGDPAAWGALMEREGVWAEPFACGGGRKVISWQCARISEVDDETIVYVRPPGGIGAIGEAVCCAVLSKHGIDPTPYIGD